LEGYKISSIIRLSGNNSWGTAFAVELNNKINFVTAGHVLIDCGVAANAHNAQLLMCDDTQQFLSGPKLFDLTNIRWENNCDYVEFESDFPATPFTIGSTPSVGDVCQMTGYLYSLNPRELPDCGVVINLSATVLMLQAWQASNRQAIHLDVQTPVVDMSGMSGAPIIDSSGSAIGVFQGSLNKQNGGAPYVATTL